MNKQKKPTNPRGLSDREMERFLVYAPNALAGRNKKYYLREFAGGWNVILLGLLPIFGMVFFGWSAADLLVFLLIGLWFGIICDGYKLIQLNKQINSEGEKYFDEMYVWATVDVMRKGRSKANQQQRNAKYAPEMGCVVDVIFGGIGSVFIIGGALEHGFDLWSGTSRAALIWALIFGGVRVVQTALEILARHRSLRTDPPKVACGLRGVGLFLVMFLVLMVADHAKEHNQTAKVIMIALNAVVICYGVIKIFTPLLLRAETMWLRAYLDEKKQA